MKYLLTLMIACLISSAAIAQEAEIQLLDEGSVTKEKGLEHWTKLYEVFSHPRCANCHVDEAGIPMWSGPSYGKARPHGMNIKAGESRIGIESLACGTCHMQQNGALPHSPPGAEVWLLPPVEMVWYGKSSAEICAQIQDPARNGARTMLEVAEHIANDALVHWGWAPGPGREPAPYSAKISTMDMLAWTAAGKPCPPREDAQ